MPVPTMGRNRHRRLRYWPLEIDPAGTSPVIADSSIYLTPSSTNLRVAVKGVTAHSLCRIQKLRLSWA